MNICSVCRQCYDDSVTICTADDHGNLIQAREGSLSVAEGYRINLRVDPASPGELYKATHLASQKSVLIRFIEVISESYLNSEIQKDLQSSAGINHPNLARVFEFGKVTENELYVILEDIPGQSLRNYLETSSPILERNAIRIARQIAEALEELHKAGIIHRAVNPANIYFTGLENEDFSVKLQNLDFAGLRQKAIADGATGVDAKTDLLRYFSPEQFTTDEIDFRSDIYSLAVVLYEMLLGHSPYNALNPQAISNYVFNEQDVEKLHFDLRGLLSYNLRQSLQKRVSLRQPNSNNLARQLRHIEQIATPPAICLQDITAKQFNQKQAANVTHLNKSKPVDKHFVAEAKTPNSESGASDISIQATGESQIVEPEIETTACENKFEKQSAVKDTDSIPILESSPPSQPEAVNFETISDKRQNLETQDQSSEAAEQPTVATVNEFEDFEAAKNEENLKEIYISNEDFIADEERKKYLTESTDLVETKSEKGTAGKVSATDHIILNSFKGYTLPSSFSLNKKAIYAAGLLALIVVGGFLTMNILSWQSDAVSSISPVPVKPANLNVAEQREESLSQNRIQETEDITEQESDIPQFQGLRENNIPKTKEALIKTHHNESLEDASSPKTENNKLPLIDKTKTGQLAVIPKNARVQPEKEQTKITPPIKQNEKSTTNNKEDSKKVSEPIKDVIIIVGKPTRKKSDGMTRPRIVTNPKASN